MLRRMIFVSLLAATLVLPSLLSPPLSAEADGEIIGEIKVENGGSDVFWVVILPADFPQPVTLEEVRPYGIQVSDGTFRLPNLKPGKYLVALIESPSEMRVTTPTFVKVEPPEWVKADGFTGVGLWPAYEVEITDVAQGQPAMPVNVQFERKAFKQPPVDVHPPRSGPEVFSVPGQDSSWPHPDSSLTDEDASLLLWDSTFMRLSGVVILLTSSAFLFFAVTRGYRSKQG